MSKCKYYLEKEVVSYDGGITWNETGVTRKGNLYEESSEDCTDPSVQYRWINMDVTTDYICDGTNKYYKQKKQVSYDGIIWQDVTPAEYQRGSIYEVNSPDCQPTYRWINLDISTDYICDETTYTKYYKQKKQVSYGGQEWQDVIPYEYQSGDVYETESTDCGYVPEPPIYRWTDMDISTDYICEYVPAPPTPVTPKVFMYYGGGTSYSLECNGDSTLAYAETHPSGYQASAMTYAEIGNCVTTVGRSAFSSFKKLTYVTIPNTVKVIENLAFYHSTGLTRINSNISGEVNIPNGVIRIGNNETDTDQGFGAFLACSGITKVTIPDSTQLIGQATFQDCGNLETVVLGNNVKLIGDYAFRWCNKLSSVTVNATTPPILYSSAFYYTPSTMKIYVPAQSVEAYKTASGWSTYAGRIQAIP